MELNTYRNKDGFIELDRVADIDARHCTKGRSKSFWLKFFDGTEVLFKRPFKYQYAINSIFLKNGEKKYFIENGPIPYECYSALVTCEIAKFLGISAAEYDLAIYKGNLGIISYSFLKENETLMDGYQVAEKRKLKELKNGATQSDLEKEENTIKSTYKDLLFFIGDEQKTNAIIRDLIKNFYILNFIMTETDGHGENWGLIYDGKDYRLSPRYDCDSIGKAYLGKRFILDHLNIFKTYGLSGSVDILYSESHFGLAFYDKNLPTSIEFKIFCKNNLELAKEGYLLMSRIDMNKIFEKVEEKIGVMLPSEYKEWLALVTNYRIEIMKNIIQKEEERLNGKNSETELEEPGFRNSIFR